MAYWDTTQSGQYTALNNSNDFELNEGVYVLPVAETAPTDNAELAAWSPVAIVRAHAPYRIRKVVYRYDKTGTPPVIPSPESQGAFTFLGGSVAFASPKPNLSFAAYDWTVGGIYSFVENCRSDPDDGFVLGSFPFPMITDFNNTETYSPDMAGEFGAIAQAGDLAKRGVNQAFSIGLLNNWLYNSTCYFPGDLLNNQMVNGVTEFPSGTPSTSPIQQAVSAGDMFRDTKPAPVVQPNPTDNSSTDVLGNSGQPNF